MFEPQAVAALVFFALLAGCGSNQLRRDARSCEFGDNDACLDASTTLEAESDKDWRVERESWHRRRACQMGHGPSCDLIALLAELRSEFDLACTMHVSACLLDHQPGCESVAYLRATDTCEATRLLEDGLLEGTPWLDAPPLPNRPPAGTPTFGKQRQDRGRPNAGGFLTREQVQSRVRGHDDLFRSCYERVMLTGVLTAFAPLSGDGRVSLEWTIWLDGRVMGASIEEDTFALSLVADCAVEAVRRLRFDEPDGGLVSVTYPFSFRSEAE